MSWRPVTIPEFAERYEVSDAGLVRNSRTGYVLTPMRTGYKRPGAQRYKVRFSTNPRRDFDVAHLVLWAFVGPRPAGYLAMHADDNAANNRAANLSWGTPAHNTLDAARRVRCGGQKVGPAEVAHIIEARAGGETGASLARRFSISQQRVCDIVKGRSALARAVV